MSMISGQCDELRNTADELDERAKAYAPSGRNVVSPMLREAADTIWELRCKLVDAVDQSKRITELEDENAKLQEQIHWLKKGDVLHVLTDQELADQQRHEREMQASINALFDENTKLRELLVDTLIDPRDYCAKYGIDYDGWDSANDDIDRRLRELGIEVTDD